MSERLEAAIEEYLAYQRLLADMATDADQMTLRRQLAEVRDAADRLLRALQPFRLHAPMNGWNLLARVCLEQDPRDPELQQVISEPLSAIVSIICLRANAARGEAALRASLGKPGNPKLARSERVWLAQRALECVPPGATARARNRFVAEVFDRVGEPQKRATIRKLVQRASSKRDAT
jgi:hypothetical protein